MGALDKSVDFVVPLGRTRKSTLEEAALGDVTSQQRLQRISSEIQSQGGIQLGSAQTQSGEITGLIED